MIPQKQRGNAPWEACVYMVLGKEWANKSHFNRNYSKFWQLYEMTLVASGTHPVQTGLCQEGETPGSFHWESRRCQLQIELDLGSDGTMKTQLPPFCGGAPRSSVPASFRHATWHPRRLTAAVAYSLLSPGSHRGKKKDFPPKVLIDLNCVTVTVARIRQTREGCLMEGSGTQKAWTGSNTGTLVWHEVGVTQLLLTSCGFGVGRRPQGTSVYHL